MALTGEEIRARLSVFAARWSVHDGSERGEAQTFLNELFDCYGTSRPEVATFEQAQQGRFLDLVWPGTCLFEMKAPAEAKRLAKHRLQALEYWIDSSDAEKGVEAPRFVVLCAFRNYTRSSTRRSRPPTAGPARSRTTRTRRTAACTS